MGQVRKENIRDYWSTDPTISTPIFLTTLVGTILKPLGRPGILMTTASKHRIRGSYSKFGPCMNILYRNLGQFTNLGQNYHTYHNNFYNNVRLAQTLLDRNMRVCGTMRANRGISCDLEGEGKCLKKGQSAFWRKGDIMVHVWKDKRLVQMTTTFHDTTIVNKGRIVKTTW